MEGSLKRHAVYEKKLTEDAIVKVKTTLPSFLEMRWTAKSDNLNKIMNTLPAVMKMLIEMSTESESAAGGLLVRLN